LNFKAVRKAGSVSDIEFRPFYERSFPRTCGIVGRVGVSVALGLFILGLRWSAVGTGVFRDSSWLLALLIVIAMLCLYVATHTLRQLLRDIRVRWPSPQNSNPDLAKDDLSARKFVAAGIVFGLVNCAFGLMFGLPAVGWSTFTLLVGFFVAGFICGMAVFGIVATSVIVGKSASDTRRFFDFTAPDGCGGTSFVGGALTVFGSVTLLVGVMISLYVLRVDWTHSGTWRVDALEIAWIVFPYLMSLFVVIAPAASINSELRQYKLDEELKLQSRAEKLVNALEAEGLSEMDTKSLRESYELLRTVRQDLHKMRTWPFSWEAKSKYVSGFVSTGAVHMVAGLAKFSDWIAKPLGLFMG
jgi:hypothetical protein